MSKILIISSEFPPLPGGIGNHALHLAIRLQQNDLEISVLTNQRSLNINDDLLFDKSLNFNVYRISRNRLVLLTYINRIFKAFSLIKTNETVITSGKFSLWLGALLNIFFKRKLIAVVHGSEINAGGKWSKRLTIWSLKKHDKIVAVSNFTKNLMLDNCQTLNIEVINNGFEIPIIKDKTPPNGIAGNPAIITIGNVTYRKGQQNVIKALPNLLKKHPNIHYHIIGLPTEKIAFLALANQLNVESHITFHNAITDAEKQSVLQQAKFFFMLSDNLKNGDVEGFGIAVLEANAMGIPAIGSQNTGIADAIADGFSGKLVNPHDVNEISIAFDEILKNYDDFSKNTVEWSKQFSWDIIIKQYLEVIKR